MIIVLPRERGAFEEACKKTVKKIMDLQSKDLLHAIMDLMAALRTHPITAGLIKGVEEKIQDKNSIYKQVIDTFEEEFRLLWHSFPQLKIRKHLVREIIHYFTKSTCVDTIGPVSDAIR